MYRFHVQKKIRGHLGNRRNEDTRVRSRKRFPENMYEEVNESEQGKRGVQGMQRLVCEYVYRFHS